MRGYMVDPSIVYGLLTNANYKIISALEKKLIEDFEWIYEPLGPFASILYSLSEILRYRNFAEFTNGAEYDTFRYSMSNHLLNQPKVLGYYIKTLTEIKTSGINKILYKIRRKLSTKDISTKEKLGYKIIHNYVLSLIALHVLSHKRSGLSLKDYEFDYVLNKFKINLISYIAYSFDLEPSYVEKVLNKYKALPKKSIKRWVDKKNESEVGKKIEVLVKNFAKALSTLTNIDYKI